jgi:hypothetical protein
VSTPSQQSHRSVRSSYSVQKRLRAACLAEPLEARRLLSAVPAPLTNVDVGTPAGGSASYNTTNQQFTLVGAGYDIFGASDAFHYVYEPLTGNGSVTVEVLSDSPNSGLDLAGINIRDSLSTTAANMWIAARDNGTVFADSRTTNGGTGTDDNDSQPGSFPEYLKITRNGDTVVGSYSTDGTNYTVLDTQTISFSSSTVLVGMAASSQSAPTTLATATFANFSVSGGAATTLTAPSVSAGLSSPYQFTVNYTSPNEVNASTVGNNNWVVQLPGGGTENATLVTTGLTNATSISATYQVPAPTTTGTYTIAAGSSPVTDLLGTTVPSSTPLGTFSVTPAVASDTVSGLVRTPTLTPVAGATITIGSATAVTDSTGAYSVSGLADGTYTVSETAPAGQQVLPHTSQSVTVSGDETVSGINFVNTAADTTGSGNNLTGVFGKPFAASAKAGAKLSSSVKVENTGTTTIAKTVNVTELLTTDGTASTAVDVLKTVPVKLNLKPGKSQTVPLSFTYPSTTTTGSYKVVAVVDSTNTIAESSKLDNVFSSSAIQITGKGGTGAHFIVAALKSAPKVTKASSKPYTFTVTYTATGSKVNPLRIGNNNWVVMLPGGSVEATLLSSKPLTASKLVATYRIPTPTVNGTYTIETSHDRAADLLGDQVAVGTIGTFTVDIPTA